jgi:hypothetical protein
MCWTGLSGTATQVFARELPAEKNSKNPAGIFVNSDRIEFMKLTDSQSRPSNFISQLVTFLLK